MTTSSPPIPPTNTGKQVASSTCCPHCDVEWYESAAKSSFTREEHRLEYAEKARALRERIR